MKIKNKTIVLLLGLLLAGNHILYGQKSISLEETIGLAQQKSLDAFKFRNLFLADYWNYQSYRSQQKPHLYWYITPMTYNRNITTRYDFENNVEVYRQTQTLNSYSSLSLSQNIVATGGNIFLETDINRLQNFGEQKITSWSTTPFRIGFSQPLFAYNSYKWQKKISPLEYETAKQDYIQSVQDINIKAVSLYFNLLLAQQQMDIAAKNVEASKKLLEIGQQRFEIASIQHEELLDLELSKFNAEIELAQADKAFKKAAFNLRSFLGLSEEQELKSSVPVLPADLRIDSQTAVELAKMLNPNIMGLKRQLIVAESNLEKAKRNEKFTAKLNASYGLNQTSEQFSSAYNKPLDQQMVGLTLTVPLLDWGDRRGQREMAQNQKEVVDIEVKQAMIDFEQEVTLKVIDFNLQAQVVESARQANELAKKSFELTQKRFVLGNADVLKLTSSMKAMQSASEKYINSLAAYWQYFYEVQRLTLYDFVSKKSLSANFEAMIKK